MIDTDKAQLALATYAVANKSVPADYPTDLVDLIADLLHLADQLHTEHGFLGRGGLGAVESALNHYYEEAGIPRRIINL